MREPREYEAPLCAQVDGDLWFPDHGGSAPGIQRAKKICSQCIHQLECAEWGINYERHGIWGGLAPKQREAIRAKRRIRLPREKSA
jgi:WhiB family redox-sensing transcriptional regulator